MTISRPARTLAAACLVVATLLGLCAGPASALEPPRPLPGHRPAFVTETDTRPWIDCLWASAAMLLDKWTNGDVRVSHGELRALSGDDGGSSFEDVQVAFRRLGFAIALDARGDSTLTWGQLLTRLRKGAGAVILGDDSQLPRYYGRWDHGFWKKDGDEDNHAVYVERYDARRGRAWIMDPLARGPWRGEWISVRALKRFAWFKGGHVVAITTPTARPAPFSGVSIAQPEIGLSDRAISATWRLRTPRRWRYPGADIHVRIARAADPLGAAIATAEVGPRVTIDAAPRHAVAGVRGRTLRIAAALPTEPGAYTASMSLTDRRFGRRIVASRPVAVFVPGARRATLRLNVHDQVITAGGGLPVNVSVANTGSESWADNPRADSSAPVTRSRGTRVVARWVRLDGRAGTTIASRARTHATKGSGSGHAATSGAGGPGAIAHAAAPESTVAAVPLEVQLKRVPLVPGRMARIRETLVVPRELGRWALVVDVVDEVDGSFAALGSAPAVALFEVVAPRGIEPVD